MNKHFIPIFIALFIALVTPAGSQQPARPQVGDPIVGKWQFFNNTTRIFRPDGTSTNGNLVQDAIWKCVESTPGTPRKYAVTYVGGKFVDTLTLKNGDAFLDGMNNLRTHVTASRLAAPAPPNPPPPAIAKVPAANPPLPKNAAAEQALLDAEYMGMKLSPEWMPKRETKTLEMTRDLIRFCNAALEGREKDKDIMPGTIAGPLTWLMPVEEAEKKLTGLRPQMGAATLIATPNWPQRSLFVRSYFGDIADPHTGEPFKEVRLISDMKRQLVSVQFLYNHPPVEKWEPMPDGRKEPYYDWVNMKQNGSTRNQVWHQIVCYKNTGVTCIHTLLIEGRWPIGKRLENIRWYLPAPLARKILEIAEPPAPASPPAR